MQTCQKKINKKYWTTVQSFGSEKKKTLNKWIQLWVLIAKKGCPVNHSQILSIKIISSSWDKIKEDIFLFPRNTKVLKLKLSLESDP